MSLDTNVVLLGKIMSPHGVKGQLRVFLFSGQFSSIQGLDTVLLKAAKGGMETFEVAGAAVHGKKFLLSFKNYDTVDMVVPLVGRELYVKPEQLPALEEGEYYWRDLVGLRVITDTRETLGTVTEIIATGSNDVYVVQREDGTECLLPALDDVILEINLLERFMKVSPPEGLLDL